jgi:hypothetical protein
MRDFTPAFSHTLANRLPMVWAVSLAFSPGNSKPSG